MCPAFEPGIFVRKAPCRRPAYNTTGRISDQEKFHTASADPNAGGLSLNDELCFRSHENQCLTMKQRNTQHGLVIPIALNRRPNYERMSPQI